VLDFGSAAKTTLFASDVGKVQDGLFQQPLVPLGLFVERQLARRFPLG